MFFFRQWWRESYHKASISLRNDRESMLEQAANLIETKLTLLGATAIEDQLQDQVWNFIFKYLQSYNKSYRISQHYITFVGPGNDTGFSTS